MPYRILILKDRKPGHFRKSQGITKAIARHRDVSVEEITLERGRLAGSLLRRLPNTARLPSLLSLWGLRTGAITPPDLVVSAGGDTLIPNLLLARRFRCRNIFSGSPRGAEAEDFSAIVHTHADAAGRPRHVVVLMPSVIDPDALAAPLAFGPLAGRTLALLLGGPGGGFRYSEGDWTGLLALVKAAAGRGARWRVASSRRTPDRVADAFAALDRETPGIAFLDYRTAGAGTSDDLFNADGLIVTADSNTMLAEAVAARRPAVALGPVDAGEPHPSARPLLEAGHIVLLPMSADATRLEEALRAARPIEYNPLDRLYSELARIGAL